MSARMHHPYYLELQKTRDEQVPLSADDKEMKHGWQSVPTPPDDSGEWFIIDDSHDRKTIWGRWINVDHPEGEA